MTKTQQANAVRRYAEKTTKEHNATITAAVARYVVRYADGTPRTDTDRADFAKATALRINGYVTDRWNWRA